MAPARTPKSKSRQSIASSSKSTLSAIPPIDIPESLTPGYKYESLPRKVLDDEERARLIHELIGFDPRNLCNDITEAAHAEIYNTGTGLENWFRLSAPGDEYEHEIVTGLHALETLLESHVDKAFDKFTAWVLRNAFEFDPELQVVLPWQHGLDFSRGEYVASLPNGQEGLEMDIETLRTKVEQARYLSSRLEVAEKTIDRRIEISKQRKNGLGFIKQVVDSAGLSPLPTHTSQLITSLQSLHNSLSSLDPSITATTPSTSISNPGQGQGANGNGVKAWELGRAAYLNWALGKISSNTGTNTGIGTNDEKDKLEVLEDEIHSIGPVQGVEIQSRSIS